MVYRNHRRQEAVVGNLIGGALLAIAMLVTALLAGCESRPSRPHLYVFTADWCQSCQQDKYRLGEIVKLGLVTVHLLDVDNSGSFTHQFGIRGVPEYILYSDDVYNGGRERWRTNSAGSAYSAIKARRF